MAEWLRRSAAPLSAKVWKAIDETAISIHQGVNVDVHPEALDYLIRLYRPVIGSGIENPNHNDERGS